MAVRKPIPTPKASAADALRAKSIRVKVAAPVAVPSVKESVDTVVHSVTANLPILPAPLRPRSLLLATVETWSDGVICARLPIAALYGEGETDTEALDALGEAILDFVKDVKGSMKSGNKIGGGLLRQWMSIQALIEGTNEVV